MANPPARASNNIKFEMSNCPSSPLPSPLSPSRRGCVGTSNTLTVTSSHSFPKDLSKKESFHCEGSSGPCTLTSLSQHVLSTGPRSRSWPASRSSSRPESRQSQQHNANRCAIAFATVEAALESECHFGQQDATTRSKVNESPVGNDGPAVSCAPYSSGPMAYHASGKPDNCASSKRSLKDLTTRSNSLLSSPHHRDQRTLTPVDIPTDVPSQEDESMGGSSDHDNDEDFIGAPPEIALDVPTESAMNMAPGIPFLFQPQDTPAYYPSESPVRRSQVIEVGPPTDLILAAAAGFNSEGDLEDPEGAGRGLMIPDLLPQGAARGGVSSSGARTGSFKEKEVAAIKARIPQGVRPRCPANKVVYKESPVSVSDLQSFATAGRDSRGGVTATPYLPYNKMLLNNSTNTLRQQQPQSAYAKARSAADMFSTTPTVHGSSTSSSIRSKHRPPPYHRRKGSGLAPMPYSIVPPPTKRPRPASSTSATARRTLNYTNPYPPFA